MSHGKGGKPPRPREAPGTRPSGNAPGGDPARQKRKKQSRKAESRPAPKEQPETMPAVAAPDPALPTRPASSAPPSAPSQQSSAPPFAPSTRTSEVPSSPSQRSSDLPRRQSSAAPRSSPESSHLRSLEDKLGRITRSEDPAGSEPPPSIREQVSSAAREVAGRLAAPVSRVDEANVVDAVRDLLSSDYYLRQWGRLGMRNRSEEVDDFGLDPVYEARLKPIADFLYERYFRIETTGVESIPAAGRCLVVANHSGTLPLDGLMLRTAVRREHPTFRELRWLAEDFVYYLPFVGAFISRVGGVRACQENAERLLGKDSLVAVFPEGVKGIGKLYRDRYKLQRFGRGGFIRLALRTRTPLVPCAVIGAEEASPMLHRDEVVSKLLGLPYLPVTPTFPWLGPLGLLPAPTKWRIRFGEATHFDDYEPEAAEDPVLVGRLADRVRASIQGLLDAALGERKSVWFG